MFEEPISEERSQDIRDLIKEEVKKRNFREAANISGHFLASMLMDELEKGTRSWIEGFNNTYQVISFSIDLIQDMRPEDREICKNIRAQIKEITLRIGNETREGKKADADENDKRELFDLVHQLRKILLPKED